MNANVDIPSGIATRLLEVPQGLSSQKIAKDSSLHDPGESLPHSLELNEDQQSFSF